MKLPFASVLAVVLVSALGGTAECTGWANYGRRVALDGALLVVAPHIVHS